MLLVLCSVAMTTTLTRKQRPRQLLWVPTLLRLRKVPTLNDPRDERRNLRCNTFCAGAIDTTTRTKEHPPAVLQTDYVLIRRHSSKNHTGAVLCCDDRYAYQDCRPAIPNEASHIRKMLKSSRSIPSGMTGRARPPAQRADIIILNIRCKGSVRGSSQRSPSRQSAAFLRWSMLQAFIHD